MQTWIILAILAAAVICSPSQCLRGLQYTLTGPLGAPKLLVNPFIENVWQSMFLR